ncbi:hypothetical protein [Variovorax paradoxus]|uniref:hypothetical protein n=1 Tax=Variovorax paradoxus TaxID=34073 RepID=UPI003D661E37
MFAEVVLQVARVDSDNLVIRVACDGAGWTAQGHLEEASSNGYEDWKDGARVGIRFACALVGLPNAAVVVARITGMTSDTNPTVVAAAAALAILQNGGKQVEPRVRSWLYTQAFDSWSSPQDFVPDWSQDLLRWGGPV